MSEMWNLQNLVQSFLPITNILKSKGSLLSGLVLVIAITTCDIIVPSHDRVGRYPAIAGPALDLADWLVYRARFVAPDGRVLDNSQGGISHSEGQGYGMLFAAYYGDRPTFDRIWNWTAQTLERPYDHLSAWRYEPLARKHVGDINNATDGDLYIAWALAVAAGTWPQSSYRVDSIVIARDILHYCTLDFNGLTVLLPGVSGFRHTDEIVLNLSYYVFPAIDKLSEIAPDPKWDKIERDGLSVLREAKFGSLSLPPDWLSITRGGVYRPAGDWPARFSFAAARIPLNLSWAHLHEPALNAALSLWNTPRGFRSAPAWVDLDRDDTANYSIGPGVEAIRLVGVAQVNKGRVEAFPSIQAVSDYYQASLLLLAKISVAEPMSPGASQAARQDNRSTLLSGPSFGEQPPW